MSVPRDLRESALAYVARLGEGEARYRMTAEISGTLFTDLYAFFTRTLLDDDYGPAERSALEARVLAAQDPDTGLWRNPNRPVGVHELQTPEHVDRQLTGFALAALETLGLRPRSALRYLEAWPAPASVTAYLDTLGWAKNPWNSGNRAMQLGIGLIYEARALGRSASQDRLAAWLDWHARHAREQSGFWGEGRWADGHIGMGGAAHQYVLYGFLDQAPPRLAPAVARTLRLQYPDGRFWPVIGGGSCYELDAVQVLLLGHRFLPESRAAIAAACQRATPVVLASRNPDGGFCWARRRFFAPGDALRVLGSSLEPRIKLWTLRAQASAFVLRNRPLRVTAWAEAAHGEAESSLFDTWFRLLTLAEIARITGDAELAAIKWRALPAPNWGHFRA